jgi:hypothetical protein
MTEDNLKDLEIEKLRQQHAESQHLLLLYEQHITHLRASELAWQFIAKQNDRWEALTQSEKEAALHKALDAAVANNVKLIDALERIRTTEGCPRFIERMATEALTNTSNEDPTIMSQQ